MARPYHSTANLSDVKNFLKRAKDKTRQAFHRSHETISCSCCYDDHPPKDLVRLPCQHNYCKQCFHQLVLNAIQAEANWPPRCCGAAPIDHNTCLKNTPRALTSMYKQKRLEYSVPIGQRYYCPAPDCGLFVPADKDNTPFRRARCKAKHATCMDCGQAAHADAVQCPRNKDMELVQGIARLEGWRRCYRCLTMIEHTKACRHWTCGCTEGQLKAIKKRAKRTEEERRWEEERKAFWEAHAFRGLQ
ncbi:hypothetical protein INS49_007924 [Diaporthe citri]|uniref:uncharacterized protein n=1 Tax=Diaporthe citri TaxID=83186 RepID=UPI001C7F34E5|nr:uncharacterized protein INS49_007924 [Diaporthe citri]KAG6362830.1 hypothetical protein INS49_007924 [Diaporthe citri]